MIEGKSRDSAALVKNGDGRGQLPVRSGANQRSDPCSASCCHPRGPCIGDEDVVSNLKYRHVVGFKGHRNGIV
jgi:hypothetical protein